MFLHGRNLKHGVLPPSQSQDRFGSMSHHRRSWSSRLLAPLGISNRLVFVPASRNGSVVADVRTALTHLRMSVSHLILQYVVAHPYPCK
jgi:hypothetical protein